MSLKVLAALKISGSRILLEDQIVPLWTHFIAFFILSVLTIINLRISVWVGYRGTGYQGEAVVIGQQVRCGRDKRVHSSFSLICLTGAHINILIKVTQQKVLFASIWENQWKLLRQGTAQPFMMTGSWLCIKETVQSDVIHPLAFVLHWEEGLCNGKIGLDHC